MVNLYVRSFEKIDDVKMEFSVQITFRKCFFSLRQFKAEVQTVSTKQSSILMDSDFQRWLSWISIVKLKWENPTFTPRQQWNDNRLAFNSIGGKIRYLTMTEKDKVRGREEVGCSFYSNSALFAGLDAGYVFQEREGREVSRYHSAKPLCSGIPWRRCAVQHQVGYYVEISGLEDKK